MFYLFNLLSHIIFEKFNFFFNLIDIYNNSIYFYDLNISMVGLSTMRDKNGRFISKQAPLVPLPNILKDAIIGDLLGDGHLRFTHKGSDGLPKPNANAHFAMTLKSKEYATYLWKEIYNNICTSTPCDLGLILIQVKYLVNTPLIAEACVH